MAGVPGGRPAVLREDAAMQQVMMPKYFGTMHLQHLFSGINLDFIALFSSIAALTGGIGQCDYASANAYMDAVATSGMLTCAKRVVSIDWDAWKGIGMAFTTAVRLGAPEAWFEELEQFGIGPAEGLKALFSILASEHRQVLVSKRALTNTDANPAGVLYLRKPPPKAREMEAGAEPENAVAGLYKRPKISVEFVAPRTEVEKALAQHWSEALNLEKVGVDDDFFELGGHSLLALELIPRLRLKYKIELNAREVFEQTADAFTIARFAAMIEARLSLPHTS
jgi:acyl carrier protein